MHIIIEGLDGTGKTTLLNALKKQLEDKEVFDVVEFEQQHNRLPHSTDTHRGVILKEADVLLLAEPTHSGMGKIIRTELIGIHEREYNQTTVSQAYAIDREILLKRIVVPALQRGQDIIQSRSWISTLVYQKALDNNISIQELRSLPGNMLAEQHLPDAILYTRVHDPELILERMKGRKYDKHENLNVQEKVFREYESNWLKNYVQEIGLTWKVVDVSGDVESGITNFLTAYQKIIS